MPEWYFFQQVWRLHLLLESHSITQVGIIILINKDKTELIQYLEEQNEDYVIPESIVKIGCHAFFGCYLKSIIIPNSVKEIGCCAFVNCPNLASIIIPESVTEIGDNAFANVFITVHHHNPVFTSKNGKLKKKRKSKRNYS